MSTTTTTTDLEGARTARAQMAWILVGWVVLTFLFGFATPDNRFEAEDALDYAAAVEFGDARDLIAVNHLGYLPTANGVYEVAHDLNLADRAVPVLVWLGAVFAASACVLFVLLLHRWIEASWPLAIFGGVALAASFGFWRYAAEVEVYSPAALAAIGLLLAAATLKPSWRSTFVIAVLAFLAIMAHTLNIALVVALPFLLWRRGWRPGRIFAIAALGLALLLPTLWTVYDYSRTEGIEGARQANVIEFYSGADSTSSLQPRDLVLGLILLGSVVIASNSVFLYEPVRERIPELFEGRALAEELHMGATDPAWLAWIAPVAMVAAIAALVWLATRIHFRSLTNSKGFFLGLWILAYLGVVALGGSVTQPEIWILLLAPLWAVVVLGLRSEVPSTRALVVVGAALAVNTLVSGLLPVQLGGDRRSEVTEWLADNTTTSDILLTADSSGLARYIAYYRPPVSAHLGSGSDETARANIEGIGTLILSMRPTSEMAAFLEERELASGHRHQTDIDGRIYVTADMFDPPEWLSSAHPEIATAFEKLGTEVGDRFETADPDGFYLVLKENVGGSG